MNKGIVRACPKSVPASFQNAWVLVTESAKD